VDTELDAFRPDNMSKATRIARRRSAASAVPAALMIASLGLIGFGVWRAQREDGASEADWSALPAAMQALREGAPVSACDPVSEGAPKLTCLQFAQGAAVQHKNLATLRAACEAMTEEAWRQSCLLDALALDPALNLVRYVDACEEQVPLYAFHCETHARNRMEGRLNELPLLAEDTPEQLVRVFPKLVANHTAVENAITARAFGARLRASGLPEHDCANIDPVYTPPCSLGYRQ
jgi:hypothetical protein